MSAETEIVRRTRRDFLALAALGAAGFSGWHWLRARPHENGLPSPFRRVLEFNRRLTSFALFSNQHLAPEFPRAMAGQIRVNGQYGLTDDFDPAAWRLEVTPRGQTSPREHTLDDIRSLPRVELTAEFKCIEGWSSIVHWTGARFTDFVRCFAPGSEFAPHVALATPDGEYFVGIDMPSALHPQTLLCYAMNGQPLEDGHGAPLRLVTPVKYGIKNIKRIGSISFPESAPRDFWAEQGYDDYAGL